jgi:hypothetical protein
VVNPTKGFGVVYSDDSECALFGKVLFALDKSLVIWLFEHTTRRLRGGIWRVRPAGALASTNSGQSSMIRSCKAPGRAEPGPFPPVDEARMCKDAEEMRPGGILRC